MSHYRIYDSSFYFRESTSLKAGIDVPLLSMAKNKYSFIYRLSGIRQLLYQSTWSNAYHKILDLRRWLFKTHCHCSSRICQCVHCTRIVFLPDLRTFFWWHIFSPPSLENVMSKWTSQNRIKFWGFYKDSITHSFDEKTYYLQTSEHLIENISSNM